MTHLTPAVFALLGSTFAATAALAAVQGDAPPVPMAAVQIGDRDLSCKALAAQIDGLSQAQARKVDQAARGRRLFGFATAALQMAAPLAGNLGGSGAGGLIGAVSQQGAMAAMQNAAAPVRSGGDADAGQADGRRERLEAIFDRKGC